MYLLKDLKYQYIRVVQKKWRMAKERFVSSSETAQPQQLREKLAAYQLGQPTFATHPHLIKQGELMPGIALDEFKSRRNRMMTYLQLFSAQNEKRTQKTNSCHLVVIPSATKKFMSNKIPYGFRQNTDFLYLTGCQEPDTVLTMSINERSEIKSTLFMRPKNPQDEMWDGPRTGVDAATDLFGVDEAYPVDLFRQDISRHIRDQKPLVWYDSRCSDLHNITGDILQAGDGLPLLNSPVNFVQSLRLFKSPAEQALMRHTCKIAADAINETMCESRAGESEHHIHAKVDYKCRMRNAHHLAYPPVVAAGKNATTVHYCDNSQLTKEGDLVVIDAGCEYGGYSSDITRTWAISGKFTEPQRVLYDIVLRVQKELIDNLLKDGCESLDKLCETMTLKLGKYLQEIGLISKSITDKRNLSKAAVDFCPHHVAHYLGMDIHDTHLMPSNIRLLPGMVFTVEPAIYIPNDRTVVPKEFRGIGVRVEDDILIAAENKVEVLSADCMKELSQLENLQN